MHVLWQQRLSWPEEDCLIWRYRRGLTAEERPKQVLVPRNLRNEVMESMHDSRYAGQLDIGTSEKPILLARNERRRAVCDEERPDEEQPCANAGHDRGIPPAASRRGHPETAGKDLVLESVRPGPDGWLHQVDGLILPHQHLSWYRGQGYIAYFSAPDYLHSDPGRSFEASVGMEMSRLHDPLRTIRNATDKRRGQPNALRYAVHRVGPHAAVCHAGVQQQRSRVHGGDACDRHIQPRAASAVERANWEPDGARNQGLPEYIRKTRERIDGVHELVMDHLKTQQRRQKCLHDRHANETHFRQNDRVWLAVPRRRKPYQEGSDNFALNCSIFK
ncbi:hypothetical protein T07_10644 [Trichinella nelsoni]|uniref:Uncharacterized protein n=1 Tax=Trichinella nelsoni TaxID=6336 RepID=A0A0V0SFP4_9BILA|nr:hypothetical protein T07_10644 [Trichinella nelsoni]